MLLKNLLTFGLCFFVAAGIVAGVNSNADAANGCADGKTKFVWRKWTGSGYSGPGQCTLNKCVRYTQEQKVYSLSGFPPVATHVATYEALNGVSTGAACPAIVNGLNWAQ